MNEKRQKRWNSLYNRIHGASSLDDVTFLERFTETFNRYRKDKFGHKEMSLEQEEELQIHWMQQYCKWRGIP